MVQGSASEQNRTSAKADFLILGGAPLTFPTIEPVVKAGAIMLLGGASGNQSPEMGNRSHLAAGGGENGCHYERKSQVDEHIIDPGRGKDPERVSQYRACCKIVIGAKRQAYAGDDPSRKTAGIQGKADVDDRRYHPKGQSGGDPETDIVAR